MFYCNYCHARWPSRRDARFVFSCTFVFFSDTPVFWELGERRRERRLGDPQAVRRARSARPLQRLSLRNRRSVFPAGSPRGTEVAAASNAARFKSRLARASRPAPPRRELEAPRRAGASSASSRRGERACARAPVRPCSAGVVPPASRSAAIDPAVAGSIAALSGVAPIARRRPESASESDPPPHRRRHPPTPAACWASAGARGRSRAERLAQPRASRQRRARVRELGGDVRDAGGLLETARGRRDARRRAAATTRRAEPA